MMREMQTTYGRNVGGYLWAFLEPIGAILVFVLVIAYGIRIREPGLGTSFALFYASGFMPLTIFLAVSQSVASSLKFAGPLLSYPGVQYTDALIARFTLAALTQTLVTVILLVLIHAAFGVSTILHMPSIIESLLMSVILGFGIGTLNCYLFEVMPLWKSAWSIITRPLFIISCVFFTYEVVPRDARDVLWWNPIIHCGGMMRRGLYATYDAPWVSWLYVLGVSLTTLLIGMSLLHRYHSDILNR